MNPPRELFRATRLRSLPRLAAAPAAGILLYAILAGAERLFSASLAASAFVEEGAKAFLLLGCGYVLMRRREAAAAPVAGVGPALRTRAAMLGAARGLSFGLVAAAAFAGAESLAYLAAFRDAAVLGRITWSLPVHIDAALVEALASLPLLRAASETIGRGRLFARGLHARGLHARRLAPRFAAPAAIWIGGLAAASLWHLLANSLAAGNPSPTLVATGSALGIALLAALSSIFARNAYIGGFLHGQR